jgi:hypothetical protein
VVSMTQQPARRGNNAVRSRADVEADRIVSLVLSQADRAMVRVVMLLSVAITLSPSAIVTLAQEVWDDDEDYGSAITRLERLPFVLRSSDGWRLSVSLSQAMSMRFRDADGDGFRRAHELLVEEVENEYEVTAKKGAPGLGDQSASLEGWFVLGRLAFYLAANAPEQSAARFGEAFVSPPTFSPAQARRWLTDLVLRQEPLLEGQIREVTFFRAFDAYTRNRKELARRLFAQVIQDKEAQDVYRAIALHLWAAAGRSGRPAEIAALRESVALSEDDCLSLPGNEVMSRNSLVWGLVSESRADSSSGPSPDLSEAIALANSNLTRARDIGDKGLQAWCLRTRAWVSWLAEGKRNARGSARPSTALVEGLLADLSEAASIAESRNDLETSVFSLVDAAEIHYEVGHYEDATHRLVEAGHTAEGLEWAVDDRLAGRALQLAAEIVRRDPRTRDSMEAVRQVFV